MSRESELTIGSALDIAMGCGVPNVAAITAHHVAGWFAHCGYAIQ